MNFTFLADEAAGFWFPPAASTFAKQVDFLYMAILWISILFFVPIVIAMLYFMVKFRQRPGYKGSPEALHNTPLEITWTVVPTFIVVWIFWEGMIGFLDMTRMPDDTVDVAVTAVKWNWSFKYKQNGAESTVLYLPVGKDIKLTMQSKDVLHSFFVPAFRAKRDVVPGRYQYMWFHPTKEGIYDLFCTEYCGDNHSTMITKVEVMSDEKYAAKLAELVKEPEDIVERGKWLYERKACKGCHYAGTEGAKGPGPSYNGSWGKQVPLADGREVKFDENFVRESILNPAAAHRKGYETASAMPSYKGQLKDEQIDALIAFIQSLETVGTPAK
ncbi:Cytochrome c oxidase subunit 2 precursor [Pirellula sp. SH-Sr6A]|uniref:cytochrome c oxidase subunit II n=1 Tax=Pirellula sp. SH-Sr6A TaxID=1632865 RepID=UPI00078B2E9D|nr:cytochrome c oxidase subunit II [Pirellula sp. SH-Sr6A]AMV34004.1 Cytochrome c oxidase subunit 2 precursor [Pirellula sp. SH-Sr6A]